MTTLRKQFGGYPAVMQMAALVGVDVDAPLRVYDCSRVMTDPTGATADPDLSGLVHLGWEEGDWLVRDGQVLWMTESARFYIDVYLLLDANTEKSRVGHFAMSNNCAKIGAYNNDVEPKCQWCKTGSHSPAILEIDKDRRWCKNTTEHGGVE